MITVKDAWHKPGYSSTDHLLNNTELEPVIGSQFRTVAEARKAAEKLSSRDSRPSTGAVPIGLEVLFEDGTSRKF